MIAFPFCFECKVVGNPHVFKEAKVSATELSQWFCHFGHEQWCWVENPFYELLFLRGGYDLFDRDYRNSVLNFVAAYEAFVAATVNLVAEPVEVQLGQFAREQEAAYYRSYFKKLGAEPPRIPAMVRDVRDEVAHHERIPSRTEAVEVGEAVRTHLGRAIAAFDPLHHEHAEGKGAVARFVEAYDRTPSPKPQSNHHPMELYVQTTMHFAVHYDMSVEDELAYARRSC